MAYIDKTFYDETFHGTEIPDEEFDRLADIASDLVYGICIVKPEAEDLIDATFQKAVAYQVELLYKQGGVDAVVGFSEASYSGGSESLGDYSVSDSSARQEAVMTYNGIPVSQMTLMLLRQLGLMTRWAYARRCCYGKKPNGN